MTDRSSVGLLPRLLRVQFTPIMVAPVVLGAAAAWRMGFGFDAWLFVLALAGSLALHLAANAIDDVYDFLYGTDQVAERMFPPNSPGWKPMARGYITARQGLAVSYALYGVSTLIGLVLSVLVGWYALLIAVPGILLSYFYTAPPLKLDYRGLGLGEVSILFSFGPIPALGVYYVLSGHVDAFPFLLAVPSGVLTAGILMSHDLIFYDAYKESGKRSLTVVLGRKRATVISSLLPLLAYAMTFGLVAIGVAPLGCLAVAVAAPLLVRLID
ncbi:MAG: prenyltransferase, partial [Thaumarchaeota archaeon]|nr:prenyltransferase [Nitrososphaerota archaeon]